MKDGQKLKLGDAHVTPRNIQEVQVTRVDSANVLNEGLRIGEIGRRMNSKVKLVEIGVC
jgi:hypothetical protein